MSYNDSSYGSGKGGSYGDSQGQQGGGYQGGSYGGGGGDDNNGNSGGNYGAGGGGNNDSGNYGGNGGGSDNYGPGGGRNSNSRANYGSGDDYSQQQQQQQQQPSYGSDSYGTQEGNFTPQDGHNPAERAAHHGDSQDSSYYGQAMNNIHQQYQQGQINHHADEDELANSHQQAHDDQGRPQHVSDPRVAGQAGAMEAFKNLGSSGAGSQSASDFMGLAMSQVSKFMGPGASGQDKQTAITEAGKAALQLFMKSQGGSGGGGGLAGGLAGLLSGGGGGGGGGGMSNLMGMASKFL